MKTSLLFFIILLGSVGTLTAQDRPGIDTTCLRQYNERAKALFAAGEQQAAGVMLFDSIRNCALGTYLPAANLVSVTGEVLYTDSIQENLLLYYTASWCGPCIASIPAINRLAAEGRPGLRIVVIFWDQKPYVAENQAKYHEDIFLVPSLTRQDVSQNLTYDNLRHYFGFPTSYAIDSDKRIRGVVIGGVVPQGEPGEAGAISKEEAYEENYVRLAELLETLR
jgi:thiol-disulfide isomerase/thioredoxin